MNSIYHKIIEATEAGLKIALCVIVNTKGSVPREAASRMIVYQDGSVYGSVGGGDLEKNVIENALRIIDSGRAELFRHDLLHQHNMCCGGTVEIFIEPIMKNSRLYIFGAGHTGHALARHASHLEFDVVIIDDRKEFLDKITLENVNKLHLHYSNALPLLPFDQMTHTCIMTYSHPYDRDILSYCIGKPHAYLGMIGSRRKVELTKKMFLQSGLATEEQLNSVDMPMGFAISAETPDEIAISILAKLIEVKRSLMLPKHQNEIKLRQA